MVKRYKKLFRLVLTVFLVINQAFLYIPVNADESESEASSGTTETINETTAEQTATNGSSESSKATAKENNNEIIASARNGKEFVKGVSKLPRKYRLTASSKKGMPKLNGAEGVNFGASYVLSFKSKDAYESAIKELEKKDIDYCKEASFGICTDECLTCSKDVKVNPEAKIKIAIIDTGSDIANEKISLLGDDGSDNNGHGTEMATLILNNTNDAYIISVKAVADNGKGSLSDVYAGVRYAIDHKCEYILMAISLKDNGEYEEFISLINEATSKGIKVIASAGNNNADASGYIPAGIDGVVTAGAIDNEGYKLAKSNYGKSVEYYIKAGSTSEAAAILAGLMIAGKTSGLAKEYLIPEDQQDQEYETGETDDQNDEDEEDGPEFSVDKSKMTWPTKNDLISAGYLRSEDFGSAVIKACKAMKGAKYGTGNGKVDCMRYVNLAYAQALKLISGLKVNSKDLIPGLKRKNGNVTYNGVSLTNSKYHLVDGCTTWSKKSPHNIGAPGGINIKKNGGLKACLSKLGAKKGSIILFGRTKNKVFKWTHAAIYAGSGKKVYDAPGGDQKTGVPYSKSESGSGKKKYTHVAVLNYPDFVAPAKLAVKKASATPLMTNLNRCYQLAGTKYGLYDSAGKLLHEFIFDNDGKTDVYQIKDINKKYYIKELAAGSGYVLSDKKYNVNFSSANNGVVTINVSDEPIGSDSALILEKNDAEGWDKITGIKMSDAVFRVDYYDSVGIDSYKDILENENGEALKAKVSLNINGTSDANGKGRFEFSLKTLSAADPSGYFSKIKGLSKLPLGTYVITEIKPPKGYKETDASKPLIMKIRQEGNSAVVYYSADPSVFTVLEEKIVLNEAVIKGKASFIKKMLAPEGVNVDLSTYSLEGTTFSIFYKESGNTALTVVFGKDGRVKELSGPDKAKRDDLIGEDGYISLPVGEYIAKEVHSGYGFYLDTEQKEFEIIQDHKTDVEFADEPVFTGFDCLLKKVKNEELSDNVISMIPVNDAQFRISYYAGFYEGDSYKEKTPSRKWIFKTDIEGILKYDNEHFVSGDKLFTDQSGRFIVPQGTYVISETQAPSGSELSKDVRVIVVRFAKDIIKGSSSDPAGTSASRSTIHDKSAENFSNGKTEYYNDYKTAISTLAVSTASGTKEIAAEKGVSITDILTYTNILPGYTYKIRAWLVRSDGTKVVEPFDTQLKVKTDEERSGNIRIPFVIDASILKGETLTVMEEFYIIDATGKEHLYLKHDDISNIDQQINIPDIKTELIDEKIDEFNNKENSRILSCGKDVTLIDYVSYKNLIPGNKYKLTGTLLDKESGKPLLGRNDRSYKVTLEFMPESKDGYVKVKFEHIDTTMLKGDIVATEKLNSKGVDLVTHFDLNDDYQTLRPVKIKTSALEGTNKTHTITYSETADIIDTVKYKGLKAGKKYQINGTLMDKGTGKPYVDHDGNSYSKSVEFTPEGSDGTVEVKFEKVKISYEYKAVVVFEKLMDTKTSAQIAVHENINDEEQTVYRPYASTVASAKGNSKIIPVTSGKTKISDKVMYKGFTPGKTYLAVATLYKTDGTQIMNDGIPVTNSIQFTPEKSDGTVTVPLEFKLDSLKFGESVVIFENIIDVATDDEKQAGTQERDIEIVRHNDLNNKDQTLKYQHPPIPKTGEETSPAMVLGLLILAASAGPLYFAVRVKHGERYRAPRRSQRMPAGNSLLCSLKRRMRDGSSRVWRNWNP